jgi:5-methylcytosine-specific restriction protein A
MVRMLRPRTATTRLSVGAPLPEEPGNYGQGRGGRPWRRLRERILRRDGYQCQPCKRGEYGEARLTMATQVDHITPQAEGGKDDEANLQGICNDCHALKTAEESKRGIERMRAGT